MVVRDDLCTVGGKCASEVTRPLARNGIDGEEKNMGGNPPPQGGGRG